MKFTDFLELFALGLPLAASTAPPTHIDSIDTDAQNTPTQAQIADPITQAFRLHTYNIRYAAPAGTGGVLEANWTDRRPLVSAQLAASAGGAVSLFNAIPIIGLQEALSHQLGDIKFDLENATDARWEHVGVARDDGQNAGEFVPLLYRPDQLRLLETTNRWLSPTPGIPSKGWNAGYLRTVAIGVFEVIGQNKTALPLRFIAACTHLDNESALARINGAKLILDTLREVHSRWGANVPVFLMGDFNSGPYTDGHEAVRKSGMLVDSREMTDEDKIHGPEGTYLGFDPKDERKEYRIDYIFLGPSNSWLGAKATNRWDVKSYTVIPHDMGRVWASDHRGLVVDVDVNFGSAIKTGWGDGNGQQ